MRAGPMTRWRTGGALLGYGESGAGGGRAMDGEGHSSQASGRSVRKFVPPRGGSSAEGMAALPCVPRDSP